MKADQGATQWEGYYASTPCYTRLTRDFTAAMLAGIIRRQRPEARSVIEFGGGNSCVYPALRALLPRASYTVVDTSAAGVDLFREKAAADPLAGGVQEDIFVWRPEVPADVVFSIGLIEHFPAEGTVRAIARHFECAAPGGLVILTFPTPTWLYRAVRFLAERRGAWRFPDERPLGVEDVAAVAGRFGQVRERFVHWKIGLTQGVVAAVKAGAAPQGGVRS